MSLVGIPTTLHDSLMARLDRLASVRLVAQIGAAIGREFSYRLLHAVSRLPDDELQAVTPSPAPGSCGSSWVRPRSSYMFLMGSLAITSTAAN